MRLGITLQRRGGGEGCVFANPELGKLNQNESQHIEQWNSECLQPCISLWVKEGERLGAAGAARGVQYPAAFWQGLNWTLAAWPSLGSAGGFH